MIRTSQEPLHRVIRIRDGTFPPNFPATLDELNRADETRIGDLLLFYDLDPNGTITEKELRLQFFLGCNLFFMLGSPWVRCLVEHRMDPPSSTATSCRPPVFAAHAVDCNVKLHP